MQNEKIRLLPVRSAAQLRKIRCLYKHAFPRNERKAFFVIRHSQRKGCADLWYLEYEGAFAGLAITMNARDLVLLDYFAIDSSLRSKGLGSAALHLLQEQYKDKRFFLEIESVYLESPNKAERLRRKQFYLRGGMTETGVRINVYGMEMELLSHNCPISYADYCGIYQETLGRWITKRLLRGEVK